MLVLIGSADNEDTWMAKLYRIDDSGGTPAYYSLDTFWERNDYYGEVGYPTSIIQTTDTDYKGYLVGTSEGLARKLTPDGD